MLEKFINFMLILFVVPAIILSLVILPFALIIYLIFRIKAKRYGEEML